MAHGSIRGVKRGVVHGIKHNALTFGGLASTQDGTSGKYVPSTSGEWTAVMTAAGIATGNPGALWLCQDALGNLADSIGSFTLTAAGTTRLYQQAVTGWSRFAVQNQTDGGTSSWSSSSASLPDISVASLGVLAYVLMPTSAPGSTRQILAMGTTTRIGVNINTTPRLVAVSGANQPAGGFNPTGVATVRPVYIKHDKTNSVDTMYTDQEKLTPTFSALTTGKSVTLGNVSAGAIAGGYLYAAAFLNGAAEMTDNNVRTLFQTLGWTVAW